MQGIINDYWQSHSDLIIDIGYKALIVIVVLFASRIVAGGVRRAIRKSNEKYQRFDPLVANVLSSTAAYIVYGVGLVIVLDLFGVNTTSIIALLGAAGIAIGLALKDTLSNIASGVMLLILRPFKGGEAISCGSIVGSVVEVGFFTTIMKAPDGLYISVPNSYLFGSPITNFTRNGTRRMDLVVGISYDDSIDKGLEVLQKLIEEESRILSDPKAEVMVQAMADSSVNLQLRAWTSVDDYWKVWFELNKKVKERIEEAGLSIPFPQRDVHMIQ